MKCDKKNMILYAVTDRSWVGEQSLIEQVESALKGGVSCLQLREKQLDKEAFLKEAVEMAALCRQYKVPFIINDDVDIALRCGADGVHVGQDDMSVDKVRSIAGDDLIIGVSAHSVEEALTAVRGGADYLGVGAVFQTSTKTNVTAMSYEVLKSICTAVDIPVVAIGGINKDNMTKLSGTGISGVALVSAVFAADDIERECRILRSMSEEITA
jgi:thiamine-phosphate pyrophosphorylase